MANIGTFKKSGDTNYTGEIVTMRLPDGVATFCRRGREWKRPVAPDCRGFW